MAALLGLHPVLGQLLIHRGIEEPAAAAEFLRTPAPSRQAWRLPGVKQAAWRILQALRRHEPVVVYGDYDADGQTAAAILVRALRYLGGRVHWFIPHRLSLGYGLHQEVLLEMAERGIRLVVAVDCGLTAIEPVREAQRRGLDVVVVDHHEPASTLPEAAAIVAAHQLGAWPGADRLSAAGLAYHTAMALLDLAGREEGLMAPALVQLAAIGTVADVVSLTGENRRLVREGLQQIRTAPLPGVAALARVAGVDPGSVDTYHVAYILAPRLNAAGRVDDPGVGVGLLLAEEEPQAQAAALRLEEANRARQATEREVLEQALEQAEAQVEAEDPPILVVSGEGWHPGVIGVVASRLVDRFARPALVIATEGEKARGSGRSVPGVDLYALLSACSRTFTHFGGHPMAAGFSLASADVEALRDCVTQTLASRWRGPYVRVLDVEAWVDLRDVDETLVRQLRLLEPHGEGNPRPVLASQGLAVVEARPIGADGRHLRLVVKERREGQEMPVVAFGKAEAWKAILDRATSGGVPVDLAFTPQMGRWGDVELKALELRESHRDGCALLVWDPQGSRSPVLPAGSEAELGPRRPEGATPAPAVVEDRRGLADEGIGALAGWLRHTLDAMPGTTNEVGVLVVVHEWREAVRTCAALWEHAPDLAHRVGWMDEGAGRAAAGGTPWETALLHGPRALVASHPRGMELLDAAGVVLVWQLPLNVWEWKAAWRNRGAVRVVLGYGEAERERLERTILQALPGVEELRHIFRLCSAQARVAGPRLGPDVVGLVQSLQVLDPAWRPGRPVQLVERALMVFEDLGLVEPACG
ncbi:MAG: single-stranded-DNA-specific exonuclease RecJ [Limnochordaceae bacterium]|nr:single-stranded-DNA-specific exonuclease RecJ [Limnochordaceae bacterium]